MQKKLLRSTQESHILFCFGGERGIRTPGPVKINGFQDRRIRPLCQLSNMFPYERDCKGTNKIDIRKLFFIFLQFLVKKSMILIPLHISHQLNSIINTEFSEQIILMGFDCPLRDSQFCSNFLIQFS